VGILGSTAMKENEVYVNECHDYIEEIRKKTLDVICIDDVLYQLKMDLARFV
jgi:cell division protein FtsB